MFEGDGIHHCGEKQDENDLGQNIETDLNPTDFFRTPLPYCFLSHSSQPPFAGLECLMRKRQHHDCHAHVKNDRPRIDDAA